MTFRVDPSMGGNGGAAVAMVTDGMAAQDAKRNAELAEAMKDEYCRHCKSRLSPGTIERTPGCCSRKPCLDAARREVLATIGYTPQRLCGICHEKPLSTRNRSGMCTPCRRRAGI